MALSRLMRSKLFLALALPLPVALSVACGSGTDDGKSSDDGDSDASLGADIGSPTGADGSAHDSGGGGTTGDGAVTTGDSGAKDAGAKKDAAGPGRTDAGDCIGNGGDPMFGYEFQCQTGVALDGTPCTAGHNDCPAADGCCYIDPTSDCVKANGPQCVTLTGF